MEQCIASKGVSEAHNINLHFCRLMLFAVICIRESCGCSGNWKCVHKPRMPSKLWLENSKCTHSLTYMREAKWVQFRSNAESWLMNEVREASKFRRGRIWRPPGCSTRGGNNCEQGKSIAQKLASGSNLNGNSCGAALESTKHEQSAGKEHKFYSNDRCYLGDRACVCVESHYSNVHRCEDVQREYTRYV